MKFSHNTFFWITDFGWPDISFGLHICCDGRIDIHFLKWMVSIGRVPLYVTDGRLFAASNSYHKTRKGNLRGPASGSL